MSKSVPAEAGKFWSSLFNLITIRFHHFILRSWLERAFIFTLIEQSDNESEHTLDTEGEEVSAH